MAGNFLSPDGDLGRFFVTDYQMIDQYAMTGSLWNWGYNYYGGLGDNTNLNAKSSPVQTVAAGTNWVSVSGGFTHSAGLKSDGTLWLWGRNNYGQLGNNGISTGVSSPIQTVSGGTNWRFLSSGQYHTAAIKSDGTLWAWGYNNSGQLGNNAITNVSSPVQTISGGNNWKQVSAGNGITSAIKTDGTLWSWGNNSTGKLGDNTTTWRSSPIQTVAGGTNWQYVSSGVGNHVGAIKTDGTLWLWGSNAYGQLGDSTLVSKSSPIQTISAGNNWKFVSSGRYHTAAIKADGTLWMWGRNENGQLGDNTTTNRSSPVQTIASGTTWKTVSASTTFNTAVGCHNVAIKTDGTLWTWGFNNSGQLGDNTNVKKSSPIQTVAGGNNWKLVSSGLYQSLAIYYYDAGNLYPR